MFNTTDRIIYIIGLIVSVLFIIVMFQQKAPPISKRLPDSAFDHVKNYKELRTPQWLYEKR